MAGSVSAVNSTSTTLPRIWTTLPTLAMFVPTYSASFRSSMCGGAERFGAARDLQDLFGDGGLAGAVHHHGQLVDELTGVVRRVGHREQLRPEESGKRLLHRGENRELEVFREQRAQHAGRVRLEFHRRKRRSMAGGGFALNGNQARDFRTLRHHRDETRTDDCHLAHSACGEVVRQPFGDEARLLHHGALRRHQVPIPAELALRAAYGLRGFVTHRVPYEALTAARAGVLFRFAHRVGVVRAGQALVGRHQYDGNRLVGGCGLKPRMIDLAALFDQIVEHRAHAFGIWSGGTHRRLGPTNARGGDLFHRLGDLLRILQRLDTVAKIAYGWHRRGVSLCGSDR